MRQQSAAAVLIEEDIEAGPAFAGAAETAAIEQAEEQVEPKQYVSVQQQQRQQYTALQLFQMTQMQQQM